MEITKIFLCLPFLALFSFSHATDSRASAPQAKAGYYDLDATEEINQLDRQYTQQKPDESQVIIGTFANMVQNVVSIAVNPHDPSNVANNIIQMIASMVNTTVQLSRNLPLDVTIEERQQLLNELEECLENALRELMHVTVEERKQLLTDLEKCLKDAVQQLMVAKRAMLRANATR